MKKENKHTLEKQKSHSGKGFDTSIQTKMPLVARIVLITLAVIAAAIIFYYAMNMLIDTLGSMNGGSDGGAVSGGVRNCILSVMGNAPDCSDYDGTLKTTTANGRNLGLCYGLDNSGNCIR